MRSTWLGLVGLCLFSLACGNSAGGASETVGAASFGGASAAGASTTMGGSAPVAAGQMGGTGGTSLSGGGAGQGFGGTAGSGASGGSAGDSSLPNAGASQGGAAGVGQAGSGGMSGSGLDPAAPPGKNFDLSHFALQLPVSNGSGGVEQISNLATYASQYFYSGTDGALVFWCPVTGA